MNNRYGKSATRSERYDQSRRGNGQFAAGPQSTEGLRGISSPVLPRHARQMQDTQTVGVTTPVLEGYVPPTVTEPWEPANSPRFENMLARALRAPSTPADRAALQLEREALQAQFGTIAWAA